MSLLQSVWNKWFSSPRRNRSARSLPRSQPLRLEALEERCVPAVVGTVDLSGAKLVAPAEAQVGQTITVQSQVHNTGTSASGTFQVQWYLSQDSVGSSDVLLSLANGATSLTEASIAGKSFGPTLSVGLKLPGSLPTGWTGDSFYLLEKIGSASFGQVGNGFDRDPIVVLGNKITAVITANLGGEHRPSIDVFLQRITPDAHGNPQRTQSIQFGIQTWVVIHGRDDSAASFESLAAAIDGYKAGDQVLVLDWSEGAADNHEFLVPDALALNGAAWVPFVGHWTESTLVSMGVTSAKLDLVGHSWGTYVAYEVAHDMPGGAQAIVALDPAAAALEYNYAAVNFAAVSKNSWAFYGDGLFGSAELARTAKQAFLLQYDTSSWFGVDPFAAHEAPVQLFETLVRRNNQPGAPLRASLFSLYSLENNVPGPWLARAEQGGFDGVFTLKDVNNNNQWGDTWSEVESFRYKNAPGREVVV